MKDKNIFIPDWLKGEGNNKDVVISSRVRLARNILKYPYPHMLEEVDKEKIFKEINKIVLNNSFEKKIDSVKFIKINELDELNRKFLVEKHLISPNMLDNRGGGLIVSKNENISILINEEDHLRIQSFSSGFNLKSAYFIANKIDDFFENYLTYGFHEKFGYLTSCPTNLGTGIRFSVMIHLPGIAMNRELDYIQNKLKNSGCVLRGFYGEGSKGIGHLYQVSNQITIGKTEEEIREIIEKEIKFIIEKEKEARIKLWNNRKDEINDLVFRAYGIVKYATLLTSKEAMKLLSYLRIGLSQGIVFESKITYNALNSLLVLEQIFALQLYFNKKMSFEERDKKRAILFKELLKI